MVPVAGSAYTYSYAALGEFIAWIIGWDLIIEYAVGNIGVAIGWSGHFRELISHFGLSLPPWLSTDYRSAHDAFTALSGGATDAATQLLASAWTAAPAPLRPAVHHQPAGGGRRLRDHDHAGDRHPGVGER